MTDAQILTIALATVPTMITVLIGILINNARIGDLNSVFDNMRSVPKKRSERPMRKEYDFRDAVVGKYAGRYAEGTNMVLLDPDVADIFPDSKSVNDALLVVSRAVPLTE